MLIFGIAKRRPSAEVAGSAISLALDTRQTVGDELGLLQSRRFSHAPTMSGLPPESRRRAMGRVRRVWAEDRELLVISMASSREFVEQRLRFLQVTGVEALGEPP